MDHETPASNGSRPRHSNESNTVLRRSANELRPPGEPGTPPSKPRPVLSNETRPRPPAREHRPTESNENRPRRSNRAKKQRDYIRIPYTYVRLLLPLLFAFIIIFIFSIYQLNRFHVAELIKMEEYYQLRNEYTQLEQEATSLQSQLNHLENRSSALENMRNMQADRIIEIDEQFSQDLDELTRLRDELNQRLSELVERRDSIQNQLSEVPFLPSFTTVPMPYPMEVSLSYNPVEQLRYELVALNSLASAELVAYRALAQSVEEIKPLLENYPAMWPVRGRVTSNFGWRQRPMGGGTQERHSGIDIAVPTGTEIVATGGGIVTRSTYAGAYGNLVVIDHGMGMETYYAHNSRLLVSVGETVTRGQVIALSGNTGFSTGPHLHYEVRIDGRPVNPIDFVTLLDDN